MNERIKELLDQNFGYGTVCLLHPDDLEKFAMLIIQKCIQLDIEHWDAPPGDKIREYFGYDDYE